MDEVSRVSHSDGSVDLVTSLRDVTCADAAQYACQHDNTQTSVGQLVVKGGGFVRTLICLVLMKVSMFEI